MSLTGRPSRPPLALTSSSQIFCASRADLPLAARPPVIAMLKPILIGAPDWAAARSAAGAIAATAHTAQINDLSREIIAFLPPAFAFAELFVGVPNIRATAPSRASAGPRVGGNASSRRGVAGFHD